ncbi:MAG TPA: methionine biosynthesis protein MetW [Micropepsaceae bacterium]|nr:methionine biosynthesis protein MetW [Micropepsaceae bacterium]
MSTLRPELAAIAGLVAPGSRVLDVGCGDGALLEYLVREKGVTGRGMELSQAGVNACVAHGLSVVQGDADTDLSDYPSSVFDFVILSETIQATRRPKSVLTEIMRIGARGIVSLPNFGHWKVRLQLLFSGRMPVTRTLDHSWHDTPNVHLCTIADFAALCAECGVRIEKAFTLSRGRLREIRAGSRTGNLLAETAIFVLARG